MGDLQAMLFRMSWIGVFAAILAQISPASAAVTNESALKDLKSFLRIPASTERLRDVFHGVNGISHGGCIVSIHLDPGSLLVKIQMENSPLAPSEMEVPATGINGAGDRIDVTRLMHFTHTFLLATYFERRTGTKEKGDMTLIASRDSSGEVVSISISDGQGILNCNNLYRADSF